ncbi:MAG: SDR family oxidoreductase [Proteobacteria bacterium]|nr:SDR family oxidoreductase [Pseudomonadota bacterium]
MSFDVKDKIALVTGANRGIGKAIVESLIQHGAKKVYLAVRDVKSTNTLVAEFGDLVAPLYVDLSVPASIESLAKTASDAQLVVNNAGILKLADPLNDDVEEAFNQELTVNTFGLIRMAKAFIPVLEQNGAGAFVQLNSVASIKNFAGFSTYSASKAAAYSLTQGLRDQVADKNIQVLSVHPGPIATDMANEAGMGEMGEPTSVVAEGIVKALKAGDFHLFPDTMAKQFEGAYKSYATSFIEAVEPEA